MTKLILACTIWLASAATIYSRDIIPDELYKDVPFQMDRVIPPVFAHNETNIRDFGAVPDGVTLNSEAFAKAMNILTAKGGGTLVVPSGIWLTGPITFRNNINLHLEQGALILFSENFDLYPLIESSYSGLTMMHCLSPINGKNLENIAITGKGIIDGSGNAWRFVKKGKLTEQQWKEQVASGGVLDEKKTTWYPSESSLLGSRMEIDQGLTTAKTAEENQAIKDFLRPVMISFTSCKNVWLEGVTFQNSPAWNIHLLLCENIKTLSLLGSYQLNGMVNYAGELKDGSYNLAVHLPPNFESEKDLADQIVYSNPLGNVVRLKNIATIDRRYDDPDSYISQNGKKTILLSLEMQQNKNIVEYGLEVDKAIASFQKSCPEDIP